MPSVDFDAPRDRRTPTGTVGRIVLSYLKVNGHGFPMVCVSALIKESASLGKAQSVPVRVQLHKQESDRTMKLGLRAVDFT